MPFFSMFAPYAPGVTEPTQPDTPSFTPPLVDWSSLATPVSFLEYLNQLISMLMIATPLLVGARIVQCLINIAHDPDQEATLKKRIKNAIILLILIESGSGIFSIVMNYF